MFSIELVQASGRAVVNRELGSPELDSSRGRPAFIPDPSTAVSEGGQCDQEASGNW